MNSTTHTNERGQIVYENDGDLGLARPQGGIHEDKTGGIMHDIKEGVKEGVHDIKEGMSKLADKVTSNKDHDHLSSKVTVESVETGFGDNQSYGINNRNL